MKTFYNIEEMSEYFNTKTNTYEFIEDGERIDVEFKFDLSVESNIIARNIYAMNIVAEDIDALDIVAYYIKSGNIKAGDINAWDINTNYIESGNIMADHIKAGDIRAWDINVFDIDARDISYCAVCFAYANINCTSIKGRRDNCKHFCLDGEVKIKDN